MQERETIESNEEFANYPNEFFHIFTGIAQLWKNALQIKTGPWTIKFCFSIIVSVRTTPVTSYLSSVECVQVIMWANIVALS